MTGGRKSADELRETILDWLRSLNRQELEEVDQKISEIIEARKG